MPSCGSPFANPASSHHGCAPRAREHTGAAEALQFSDPAGMIKVDVRIQNDLHILDPKSQRTNIRRDLLCRFRESPINQNVSGRRRDQNRTETMGTDIVGVGEDSKWRLFDVPLGTILTRMVRALSESAGEQERDRADRLRRFEKVESQERG